MLDWKLLDAMNSNDGSSYPFRTEGKRKCIHRISETQHSGYARNSSERHLTPAVQLRYTTR